MFRGYMGFIGGFAVQMLFLRIPRRDSARGKHGTDHDACWPQFRVALFGFGISWQVAKKCVLEWQ